MNIISAKEAKEQGLMYYYTGKPCSRKHLSQRLVSGRRCLMCKEDPVKQKERRVLWIANNRDHLSSYQKSYKQKNKEHLFNQYRNYYEKNKPSYIAKAIEYEINKNRATPPWADFDKILAFYEEAARLSRETGVKHHVDHIIPIRGKEVSGLHVHTNLRVIPAFDNLSKKNKFIPELLE